MNRVLLAIFLCLSNFAEAQETGFDLNFGLFGHNGKTYFIEKNTTKIPYIMKSEGQIFGLIITPSDNKNYTTYTVVYLPAKPTQLRGNTVSTLSDYAKGLKSPVYSANNIGVHIMWLDKGDPLGIYKLDVYINDVLRKTIEFEVVKPILN